MKLVNIRPILRTSQWQETIAFYEQKLGFTCASKSEEWGWAALQRDEVEIMIAVPVDTDTATQPAFTGSFYFTVDTDIEKLWEEYKDKVAVCYPLEAFDYGMLEFAMYDNNGYLLQFGQEVAT
jgi:uncharacterized glyoxalase superfamily protein PhnB